MESKIVKRREKEGIEREGQTSEEIKAAHAEWRESCVVHRPSQRIVSLARESDMIRLRGRTWGRRRSSAVGAADAQQPPWVDSHCKPSRIDKCSCDRRSLYGALWLTSASWNLL